MYNIIEDGSVIDVQGLPCHLPKEGYIWDYEADKWVFDGIHKRHPFHAECYWEIDKRWSKYMDWRAEELKRQKQDPDFIHAELAQFIADCWRWRLGGYWYSNNGEATYITGLHWYYLSCYNLDIGLPKYRDTDRKFFYAWQYVEEDPYAFGLNYVTKRRGGKSYQAGVISVDPATRTKNLNVGIQSKTDSDAKSLFLKAIVAPFRKVPYFFKPTSNLPAGKLPAQSLRFETGRMDSDSTEELNSIIDFKPSSPEAYDGYKLHRYIDDECGKCLLVNVADRWSIVKYCLLDDEGRIIGKALHTTTVEDMEKGGREFLEIWKNSNQLERNALGRTNSGLYNYFVAANYVRHINKYGIADHERAYEEIMAEREAVRVTGDLRALAHMIRKEPLDEREAFSADASTCSFSNIEGLNRVFDILKYAPAMFKVGNFQWEDGIMDSKVVFVECDNGRFAIAWMPDEAHRNLQHIRSGIRFPRNTDMSCGGCDPYNHRMLTVEGARTMSKGAICFVKIPNVLAPSEIDEGPCLLYLNRPAAPEMFYEDLIMAAVFYGCQVLIEDNKDKCIDYIVDRGYGGYCAWLPGRDKPGITNQSNTAGGGVNGQIANLTESYITFHVDTCRYPVLIDQWLTFSVTETTKYDAAMAFGFAKILQKTVGAGNQRPKTDKAPDISTVLPASMYADGGRTMFGY